MQKISVIIPVYNVEKYLDKCLYSIVNQTLKDIEIIIVNDGSLDNSEKIALKYRDIDSRIKYYKKENGGLSEARNYGLERACGKYISFIDSDDYIDETMLQKMYMNAEENNSDMVVCGFKSIYESGVIRETKGYTKITFKDILEVSFAWNKIYKKNLLEKIDLKFPVGKHYEDMFCIPRIALNCEKITVVSEELYYYVIRENSITTKRDNDKIFHLLEACLYNKNLVEKSSNIYLNKEWLEYSNQIKIIFSSFVNNYSIRFKIKHFQKTISFYKKLEIYKKSDFFKNLCYIFYPKYQIKKTYINLKGMF
ncbi:MAG: glycosyltransferase family 2 protein [Cetobacterium sp.]